MIRTLLTSIVLAAAIMAAADSRAQDAAPLRFFIERIEVRNYKRVSPEVVIAESRLRAGGEYSESDLRDASTRLARLPFLLAADFALEKGSQRGQHVLIINVIETRSFFFRLDFVPIYSQDRPYFETESTSHLGSETTGAALGYRWFLGRRGSLHIAMIGRESTELTSGYSAVALGYTQYDVLGTRGFATVNIKYDVNGDSISPQIVVGMPLSLNQTVTIEYDENVNEYNYEFFGTPVDQSRTQRLARGTWSYNTTNHPFFPTSGTLLSVAPLFTWRDDFLLQRRVEGGVGSVRIDPVHVNAMAIQATAVRYWELTDRVSTSGGVEIGFARFDERTSAELFEDGTRAAAFGGAQGTLSWSLWSPERRAQGGDSRLELESRLRVREDYRSDAYRDRNLNDNSIRTSISWLRRSSWGTVRVGAGYAW